MIDIKGDGLIRWVPDADGKIFDGQIQRSAFAIREIDLPSGGISVWRLKTFDERGFKYTNIWECLKNNTRFPFRPTGKLVFVDDDCIAKNGFSIKLTGNKNNPAHATIIGNFPTQLESDEDQALNLLVAEKIWNCMGEEIPVSWVM